MWFVCRGPGVGAEPWMLFPALALVWGGLEQISPQPWAAFPLLCQPCLISNLLGAKPRLCIRSRLRSCWEPRRLHPKMTWASKSSLAIPVSIQMGNASPQPRGISPSMGSVAGLCLHVRVHGLGVISRSMRARAASGAASRAAAGGRSLLTKHGLQHSPGAWMCHRISCAGMDPRRSSA